MLDAILTHAPDERHDGELVRVLAAQEAALLRPARAADRAQVGKAESEVSRAPAAAFSFDAIGGASLSAAARPQLRLLVLAGAAAATDIGRSQSRATAGMLCESPGQVSARLCAPS